MKVQFKSEYTDNNFLYNHCLKTDQILHNYLPHYHDTYEIIFLKEGDISYLTSDCVYPVRKNSLIFTRPGQLHRIRIDKDTPYDRYDLIINPDAIVPGLLDSIPEDTHVLCCDSIPLIVQLFDKLDFYCEQLNGEQLGRILRHLTEEILLNLLLHVTKIRDGKSFSIHPIVRQAVAYIEGNLSILPDVDAVCREVGVSKSYLYRLFQAELQTSPKAYIMARRLNMARHEIILGAKASTVYSQCGFTDYSTFFRAYEKQFGYPPTGTHHANFVRSADEDIFKGHWK
jgi:AraC-like DNA-binding protein